MSLNAERFVERNYSEEETGGRISSNGLYIVVHPGFGLQNDEYQELGLTVEDHFRFSYEFFSEFEEMVDSDYEIAVLQETGKDYSERFLDDYASEVDHWFETTRGEAKLRYNNADDFIDVLKGLEEGSPVRISGELNNLCEGQARQIVDYVASEKDVDLEIERGITFPSQPLIRDNEKNIRFLKDVKQ